MEIYVKNVSYNTTDEELTQHFAKAGKVLSVNIPRVDGYSLGYAFVTMSNQEDAQNAIQNLNNSTLKWLKIRVSLQNSLKPELLPNEIKSTPIEFSVQYIEYIFTSKEYSDKQRLQLLVQLHQQCLELCYKNQIDFNQIIQHNISLKLGFCQSDLEKALLNIVEVIVEHETQVSQDIDYDTCKTQFYRNLQESGLLNKIEDLLRLNVSKETNNKTIQFSNLIEQLTRTYLYIMKGQTIRFEMIQLCSDVISNKINSLFEELKKNDDEQKQKENQINSIVDSTVQMMKALKCVSQENSFEFTHSQLNEKIAILYHLNCSASLNCPYSIIVQQSPAIQDLQTIILEILTNLIYINSFNLDLIFQQHSIIPHIDSIISNFISNHSQNFELNSNNHSSQYQNLTLISKAIKLLNKIFINSTSISSQQILPSNIIKSLIKLTFYKQTSNYFESNDQIYMDIRYNCNKFLRNFQQNEFDNSNQTLINSNYIEALIQYTGTCGGSEIEQNQEINDTLINIQQFYNKIQNNNNKNQQTNPQTKLIKVAEEQIEQEGGLEEIESQLYFKNNQVNHNSIIIKEMIQNHNIAPPQFNSQIFEQLTPVEQNQYISECLYNKILAIDEQNAGKITEMLLENDIVELINFLENDQLLVNKVNGAQRTLQEADQYQQQHLNNLHTNQLHHWQQTQFDQNLLNHGSTEEIKRNIGEFIYEYVSHIHEELAGKITGMILELDLSELKDIVVNKQLLDKQIADAFQILQPGKQIYIIQRDLIQPFSGNEQENALIQQKQDNGCELLTIVLEGIVDNELKSLIINSGITKLLLYIFETRQLNTISQNLVKLFYLLTSPSNIEIRQLLSELQNYQGLIRLLDHPNIKVVEYSIFSTFNLLITESKSNLIFITHPHFQSLSKINGIEKIFSLFQNNLNKHIKDYSSLCIGLIFQSHEITNQQMKTEIINHLKNLLNKSEFKLKDNVIDTFRCLALNTDNHSVILENNFISDIAYILKTSNPLQITQLLNLMKIIFEFGSYKTREEMKGGFQNPLIKELIKHQDGNIRKNTFALFSYIYDFGQMKKFEQYQNMIERMDFWDEQDNNIDVDEIMSEIIVVLREGRENIIEKGGLVQIALRVADKICDNFPEAIQHEFEAGRFVDELFKFYEAIQPEQTTQDFVEILNNVINNTTSSQKLMIKQERYIIPLIHLIDTNDQIVIYHITQFLSLIIMEINWTGQIQQEDQLRKILENNGGLDKLVKIFQNDNFEEKQINLFVAIIIGSLHRAVKIPDYIQSSIIECLKVMAEDDDNDQNQKISIQILQKLAECEDNHTDILSGNFLNLILYHLHNDNYGVIYNVLQLILNILNFGSDETQRKVKESVPQHIIYQFIYNEEYNYSQIVQSTAEMINEFLQFIQ